MHFTNLTKTSRNLHHIALQARVGEGVWRWVGTRCGGGVEVVWSAVWRPRVAGWEVVWSGRWRRCLPRLRDRWKAGGDQGVGVDHVELWQAHAAVQPPARSVHANAGLGAISPISPISPQFPPKTQQDHLNRAQVPRFTRFTTNGVWWQPLSPLPPIAPIPSRIRHKISPKVHAHQNTARISSTPISTLHAICIVITIIKLVLFASTTYLCLPLGCDLAEYPVVFLHS